MKLQATLVAVLVCCVGISSGANILAILNTVSHSHHIWNRPLLIALAERGHNVTVLSPEAQEQPVANLTDLVMNGLYEKVIEDDKEWTAEQMSETSVMDSFPLFLEWFVNLCEFSLGTEGMKTLMNYPEDTKFDLAIIEPTGGECLLGVLHKFGSPPIVGVSAFSHPQWINGLVGNPDYPAFISSIFLPYSHRMTFLQRTHNLLLNLYIRYLWRVHYLPAVDAIGQRYFGSSVPLPTEIRRNISIVMASTHPSFDYPRPLVPALVSVAGIHIREPQTLPKDLQVFLDEAKDGVIYFSLGSNLRSEQISVQKQQAFLDAFAELPQKVLWKWEKDSMPGQPKNVKLAKWLPQGDILAHPNVRLFITHSGLLSTQEAVHRGVPLLGIPFFADQQMNIEKAVDHGVGVRLDYKAVNKETVLTTIKRVLNDPSYRQNMHELSTRFRDQPESPLDRAVYWCEYVMRHNGAHHLRSAALDLSWHKYLLLDVFALILAGILIPIILLYFCCQTFTRKRSTLKTKRS